MKKSTPNSIIHGDSPNLLKIFEMFAGYEGASFALKKAGIQFKCVGYSEIDKYAIQCCEQNHEKVKNFGDCTKINPKDIPDFDLLTGGFPCQSYSGAGKGRGEQDTRGTLFHDIIRIAEIKKPRWMLLENVKGLTFKKHKQTFNKILSELDRIGYFVHWKILNSKEYGIPQNRERVFFVCFRNEKEYANFQFQEKEELKIFLRDILEDEVDEKYYLSAKRIGQLLINIKEKGTPLGNGISGLVNNKNTANTLTSSDWKDAQKIIQINNPKHSNNRIYSDRGVSPTLRDMSRGGNRQPFIKIKTNTKKGYNEAVPGDGVRLEQPNSQTARGRVIKQLSGTLMCNTGRGVVIDDTQGFEGVRKYNNICPSLRSKRSGLKVNNGLTIRKLTPKECFRLMGFLNDEINLEGISNSQQYKLAGNGWDINLVSKIFTQIFKNAKLSELPASKQITRLADIEIPQLKKAA